MENVPKISVFVPIHNMENGAFFLWRLVRSLTKQTFKDWELIITEEGKMAENTNAGIKRARGQIIKIIYMDDYFAHEKSLENIVWNFEGGWFASGCVHDAGDGKLINPHSPSFNGILNNSNTIGSPSVIAFENKEPLLFDEDMTWVLDLDYYKRMYERYGEPTLLDSPDIAIGMGDHQMTHKLTSEAKKKEEDYFRTKWKNQK